MLQYAEFVCDDSEEECDEENEYNEEECMETYELSDEDNDSYSEDCSAYNDRYEKFNDPNENLLCHVMFEKRDIELADIGMLIECWELIIKEICKMKNTTIFEALNIVQECMGNVHIYSEKQHQWQKTKAMVEEHQRNRQKQTSSQSKSTDTVCIGS